MMSLSQKQDGFWQRRMYAWNLETFIQSSEKKKKTSNPITFATRHDSEIAPI